MNQLVQHCVLKVFLKVSYNSYLIRFLYSLENQLQIRLRKKLNFKT